ncbi:hypothetical protein [Herbaspirillum rubrisubalbicans]|uniref:hypothetical protein n=1 Tax=Herbaspirillum rubrisubalbicans TaxID=80842 RepID=UPI0015C57F7F|nr:hypothetical protein [Herbaspirillum rubrisubalbicans]
MFLFHDPVIDKPIINAPDWYRNFHNVFYLSQITTNVFKHSLETTFSRGQDAPEEEKIAQAQVLVDEVTSQLRNWPEIIKIYMAGAHLDSDLFEHNVEIDSNSLLEKTQLNSWYESLFSYLNVWNFLFVFSQVESALKQALGDIPTQNLANEAFNCTPGLDTLISERYLLDRNFCIKLWALYNSLRNIYSHSFGLLSGDDVTKLQKQRDSLFSCITTYAKRLGENGRSFLAIHALDSCDILLDNSRLRAGCKFLLNQEELNLFVFFAGRFLSSMQCLEIKKKIESSGRPF